MKSRRNRIGRKTGHPAGIAVGVVCGVVTMLLGTALLAWLIATERVGEDTSVFGSGVILTVSSAAANLCAWGMLREGRLAVAGITTAAMYALLLLVGLAFGGRFEGLGRGAALVGLGGGISLIPGCLGSMSGAAGRKNRRIVKLHKKLATGK